MPGILRAWHFSYINHLPDKFIKMYFCPRFTDGETEECLLGILRVSWGHPGGIHRQPDVRAALLSATIHTTCCSAPVGGVKEGLVCKVTWRPPMLLPSGFARNQIKYWGDRARDSGWKGFFNVCFLNDRASLKARLVKNPPAMRKTWVQSLGWEDPLKERMAIHSSILAWRTPTDRRAWRATVQGVAKSRTQLSD